VIQLSKDKVYFSIYKQKGKVLPDYKSKSPVSFLNRLKPFVNAPDKRKHNTLLKLANKEETNVI
jgi:hypothetical protein